jgi:murein L,D-transpeptidase YcbB/YkuD
MLNVGTVKHTKASNAALEKAKELGLRLTSSYRTPEHDKRVGGSGKGDHVQGEAYDFAGAYARMEQLAEWAHKSGMFSQVIFKDKDYRTGRHIGGHQDHVHIAWDSKKNPSASVDRDEKFNENQKEGSAGAVTMAIQAMLAAMYGEIKVDGKFGNQTEAAVKRFQKESKLLVDGIVGDKTWGKMTGVFFS